MDGFMQEEKTGNYQGLIGVALVIVLSIVGIICGVYIGVIKDS